MEVQVRHLLPAGCAVVLPQGQAVAAEPAVQHGRDVPGQSQQRPGLIRFGLPQHLDVLAGHDERVTPGRPAGGPGRRCSRRPPPRRARAAHRRRCGRKRRQALSQRDHAQQDGSSTSLPVVRRDRMSTCAWATSDSAYSPLTTGRSRPDEVSSVSSAIGPDSSRCRIAEAVRQPEARDGPGLGHQRAGCDLLGLLDVRPCRTRRSGRTARSRPGWRRTPARQSSRARCPRSCRRWRP